MKNENCAYCMHGDLLAQFGIFICELEESEVFLFKEQSKRGRVIVAAKKHVSEIVDLTDEERNGFMSDVAQVAKALHTLYKPGKINYGAYGDKGGHLHMHLVPKYIDGDEWGGIFEMNPNKTHLSEDGYTQLVEEIKKAIKEIC